MDFVEILQKRYTTKSYDAEKQLPKEVIEKLKETLRLSPSSINAQPWKFLFIKDKELKGKLANHSYFNKEKIENCEYLVVFLHSNSVEVFSEEIKNYLPEGAVNYFAESTRNTPSQETIHWFKNQVYISLGVFLSSCALYGVDSTAMEGIDAKAYDNLLQIENYTTCLAVAIGHRKEDDFNQPHLKAKQRKSLQEVVQEI